MENKGNTTLLDVVFCFAYSVIYSLVQLYTCYDQMLN